MPSIVRDLRFAWHDAAGRLMISQCGDDVFYPGIDDAQAIDIFVTRMKAQGTMPAAATYTQIDPAQLPRDRQHREAWQLVRGRVQIDSAKQAEIDARPAPRNLLAEIDALTAKLEAAGAIEAKRS